jgi:hypothetical protein
VTALARITRSLQPPLSFVTAFKQVSDADVKLLCDV